MNGLKTTFLLTLLTLLLVLAGQYLGGTNGALLAFAIAAATNFFSYFYSDKIALAVYGAKPVTREELPRAYDVVQRLTTKAGLPMPKIFVIPSESPNAFATGRNPQHASVAVTHGILGLLTDDELEGVLAHELGHVHVQHGERHLACLELRDVEQGIDVPVQEQGVALDDRELAAHGGHRAKPPARQRHRQRVGKAARLAATRRQKSRALQARQRRAA